MDSYFGMCNRAQYILVPDVVALSALSWIMLYEERPKLPLALIPQILFFHASLAPSGGTTEILVSPSTLATPCFLPFALTGPSGRNSVPWPFA